MKTEKLRWGVLGTARINEKVLPRIAESPTNLLQAIASRDPAKAREEGERYGFPAVYGEYGAVLADPAVDAIYLSLPNHLHAEWAENALRAGKHVLCEKPLTLDPSDAVRLSALAKEKNLRLGEGYMYRHQAQTKRVLELVRSGALGEIRRVHGTFHTIVPPGPNIRTDGRLGGGAVWDVGCYLVNFANAIVGKPPIGVSACGRVAGSRPEDDYETLFSALLNYGSGITAQLDGGFLAPRVDELRILGETGWLEIPHPFKPSGRETMTLYRRPSREVPLESETIETRDETDPFAAEIEAFAAWVRGEGAFPIAEWESPGGIATLAKIAAAIRK